MKPVFTTGYKSKYISRMWTHIFKNNENQEAIIDKPATVMLLSENRFFSCRPCTPKIHQSCNRCLSSTTGNQNITRFNIIMGIRGIIAVNVLQSFTKLSRVFYQYTYTYWDTR
jgi:hypothetical protein